MRSCGRLQPAISIKTVRCGGCPFRAGALILGTIFPMILQPSHFSLRRGQVRTQRRVIGTILITKFKRLVAAVEAEAEAQRHRQEPAAAAAVVVGIPSKPTSQYPVASPTLSEAAVRLRQRGAIAGLMGRHLQHRVWAQKVVGGAEQGLALTTAAVKARPDRVAQALAALGRQNSQAVRRRRLAVQALAALAEAGRLDQAETAQQVVLYLALMELTAPAEVGQITAGQDQQRQAGPTGSAGRVALLAILAIQDRPEAEGARPQRLACLLQTWLAAQVAQTMLVLTHPMVLAAGVVVVPTIARQMTIRERAGTAEEKAAVAGVEQAGPQLRVTEGRAVLA